MKFVDEFRDADLAEVLGREITALCEPGRHYKIMEVCGGHTHTIYRYGVQDHLPEDIELVHGPGCPVCVIPMGRVDDGIAIAERDGVILTCFGDMMRVPGSRGLVPRRQRPRRRHPDGLLAARRAADRAAEPGPPGRLLRDRLRDDGAVDGADRAARRQGRHRELLGLLQPRDDHPGHQGDPRLARPAARRVPRSRARLDGHRLPALRVDLARLRDAAGVRGLRAARPAAVGLHDHEAVRRGPRRGREPVRPGGAVRRQPGGAQGARRRVRAAAVLRVARPRARSRTRRCSCRRRTRTTTPSCATSCRACGSPTRRPASAARCSRAC